MTGDATNELAEFHDELRAVARDLLAPTNPLVTGPYARDLGQSLVAPYAKTAACRGCWRRTSAKGS